jgi:hypothetical protein
MPHMSPHLRLRISELSIIYITRTVLVSGDAAIGWNLGTEDAEFPKLPLESKVGKVGSSGNGMEHDRVSHVFLSSILYPA